MNPLDLGRVCNLCFKLLIGIRYYPFHRSNPSLDWSLPSLGFWCKTFQRSRLCQKTLADSKHVVIKLVATALVVARYKQTNKQTNNDIIGIHWPVSSISLLLWMAQQSWSLTITLRPIPNQNKLGLNNDHQLRHGWQLGVFSAPFHIIRVRRTRNHQRRSDDSGNFKE